MAINLPNVELLRRAVERQEPTGAFMPAVYVVEPVSRCNLRCVMCPNQRMAPANWGEADLDIFTSVMDQIAPYCEFLMLYWMGEPLLHPQFDSIVRHARQRTNGRIVVSSNMTVMTDAIADSLLEHADVILCCIDRWDKRAFEKVRRGATFEEVVSNTQRLLERRQANSPCRVIVKALDLKSSSPEYNIFRDYWISRGATPMLAWLNDWAGSLPSMRRAAKVPIPRGLAGRVSCADLWFKMVINWRGEVQMCCFDWNYSHTMGQITKISSLKEIWHSPKMISLRADHSKMNWVTNPLCNSCMTWGEPGELDAYVDFTNDSYFTVF